MAATDNVIAFPQNRAGKKKNESSNNISALDASVTRHPAGKQQNPEPATPETPDYDYIGVSQILPAGMQTTNIEEIDYRIKRLDAVLENLAYKVSETDMKRLTTFIREALVSTAEITYFEGLAEGYTSYEQEEEDH